MIKGNTFDAAQQYVRIQMLWYDRGRVRSNRRNIATLCVIFQLSGIGCMISNEKGKTQMNHTDWGIKTEGLAISLSVAKEEFKVNQTIQLNISLKNFGTVPVPVVVRSPWIDYVLSIQYEGRTEVEKTVYGARMIESAAEGSRTTRQLMPGEVLSEGIELNKGYSMKAPGSYKIVARRETYRQGRLDQYATVASKELVIQIAE